MRGEGAKEAGARRPWVVKRRVPAERFRTVGACLQAICCGTSGRIIACKQAPTRENPARGSQPLRRARDRRRAFTLIELVVAIGLIAMLATGISLAFRREGNSGIALRAAEAEVAANLELAQRLAVARQVSTRLLIAADAGPGAPPENVRRALRLVRRDDSVWREEGEGSVLPSGTCIVPNAVEAGQLRGGVAWGSGPVSILRGPEVVLPGGGTAFFVEFGPEGKVSDAPRRIVIAMADTAPGQIPRLVDATTVRTLVIDAAGRISREVAP